MDKVYFDRTIEYHLRENERIKEEIDSFADLNDSYAMSRRNHLFTMKTNILSAKYSRGDSLEELKDEFEQLAGEFLKYWCFDERWYKHVGASLSYVDDLRFVSLAVLLNADMKMKDTIKNKLKEAAYYDWFLDCMLGDGDAISGKDGLSYPGYVTELVCAAERKSWEPLADYLKKWYHDFKYDPWYNGHGVFDYWGKWCFAAAAAAKRFGIDDEPLKDDPFYPYDMAHF